MPMCSSTTSPASVKLTHQESCMCAGAGSGRGRPSTKLEPLENNVVLGLPRQRPITTFFSSAATSSAQGNDTVHPTQVQWHAVHALA